MPARLLRFVPDQPDLVPPPQAQEAAVVVLEGWPRDQDRPVEVEIHEQVTLFECGTNLVSVRCPRCGADLLGSGWWADAVDAALAAGDLQVTLPCCGAGASLNDLGYTGALAFGRFSVGVWDPEGSPSKAQVEAALGTRVRVVEATY